MISNFLILTGKALAIPVENPDGSQAVDVSNFGDYINVYLPAIMGIIGSLALLVFIIAGYIYMTSQGDQAKIGLAKELIIGAITGILLLFLIGVLRSQIGF